MLQDILNGTEQPSRNEKMLNVSDELLLSATRNHTFLLVHIALDIFLLVLHCIGIALLVGFNRSRRFNAHIALTVCLSATEIIYSFLSISACVSLLQKNR